MHVMGKLTVVNSSLLRTIASILDLAASKPLLVPVPELRAGLVVVDAIFVPGDIAITDVLAAVVGLVALAERQIGGR